MPSKNSIKEYVENAYYHVYNRGGAKQNIFLDDQDHKTFLSYLKIYLTKPDEKQTVFPSRKLKNYFQELNLLSYCLMPNHFHLFVFQKDPNTMPSFLQSIITKYSMYFNKKYKRVGPVFQGRYKAVMVENENQFIYLSKYIHRNPLDIITSGSDLEVYRYSSYLNYLGLINQLWLDPSDILSYFSKTNPKMSYRNFVEETDERDLLTIKNIVLDFET